MGEQEKETDGQTSIRVSMDTRDKLAALGKKGESFDMIIRRLLGCQE